MKEYINNENRGNTGYTSTAPTQELTLRQLKAMLPSTTGKKRPTPKALREGGAKIVLQTAVSDSNITVYDSGFAVYRKPGHYGVLRVDMIGSVEYEHGTLERVWTESVPLEDISWDVALYLDGEERLELQYQKRAGRVGSLSDLGAIDDEEDGCGELEVDSGVDIEGDYIRQVEKEEAKAKVDKLLSCLTERQREIYTLYHLHGMSMREIGRALEIDHKAVRKSLMASESKINKFKNF